MDSGFLGQRQILKAIVLGVSRQRSRRLSPKARMLGDMFGVDPLEMEDMAGLRYDMLHQ